MNNNNISGIKNAQTTATTSPTVLSHVPDNSTNKSQTNFANQLNCTALTREHGIWLQHSDGGGNLTKNQHQNHKSYRNNNKDYNEKEQQNSLWNLKDVTKTQQLNSIDINGNSKVISNNICDIVVVDIEDEQDSLEQQHFATSQKFIIDASMKYHQNTLHDTKQRVDKLNNNNDTNNVAKSDDDLDDDDDDSLVSMETLSDNVSIWIDGEKHWVAGVDENTTCSDLIWALLNYQNGQSHQQQQQKQNMYKVEGGAQEIDRINVHETKNQQYHEQQQTKEHHKNDLDNKSRNITNDFTNILYADNKPNKYFPSDTIHTSSTTTNTNNTIMNHINATINQSMPINTKENCKLTQNLYPVAVAAKKPTISSSSAPVSPLGCLPMAVTFPLPPGITTAAQLATEYVIVKQYHHCEEYLDGSTKVFDVLPPRDGPHKKECELLLRHLGPAPAAAAAAMYNNNAATPQLSSLISTDKDSGMGSPVGSARSAKFRRRKHKSSQWLAQANTLHPKLSRCTANERLLKIILAQDETIQRQLSLLRDKELQITKIEEEKHRKRERELGKNYLLETYLNGLDEAECEPEIQDGVETFIDEPYQQRCAMTTTGTSSKFPETVRVDETIQSKILMAKNYSNNEMDIIKKEEKEKKKKRSSHRDKLTKEGYKNSTTSIIQITDNKSKTNKDKDRDRDRHRDKEKLPNRQQVYHKNDDITNMDSNEQEIALQIQWLEKIYTLNKQLQKEEELTAKLHAKVRKHQLRRAQLTQKEVQCEIDKLDDNLALQCGDIRKIEANLMETNEQLQKKLYILERLSVEYLKEEQQKQQQQQHLTENDDIDDPHNIQQQQQQLTTADKRQIIGNLKNSLDLEKMSLNNLKSSEQMKHLQEIIAKPNLETNNLNNFELLNEMTDKQMSTINHSNQRNLNEYCEILTNSRTILNSSNRQQANVVTTSLITLPLTTTLTQTTTPLTATISVNTTAVDVGIRTTMSTSSCIDKNMLSSLPVQNAKTIKKQMFHAQTATATATTTRTTAATITTTASQAVVTNANKVPKQQFQHITQHMPMATTTTTSSRILTSRPQTSHQIPTTIVILKHPSALTLTPPTSSSSSPPISALALAPATTSSPTPSIMAMNTVDISQLGTLV